MSQTEQLLKLISDVLQPADKNLRKTAESTLLTLRTERPNELMTLFITVLNSGEKIEYRNFSASQLRLNLSNFSPATYTNVWQKLTPQVQQLIKLKLFEVLYNQADLSMKKHIADTLGEIAGSIISTKDQQNSWPNFKTNIWTLFQQQNISSNLAAFYVLESFFTYAPEHFKDNQMELYSLFKGGLSHENNKLKLSALKCFSSYLEILEIKEQAAFQELIQSIFDAVYTIILTDQDEEGLEILSEMLDVEPKFFKKKFKELNDLLQKIFKLPKVEGGVKRMATEILVDYAEKLPTLFRKKKEVLDALIEMVFFHMVDISNEIPEEWSIPPEGYNEDMEDDEDFETTRFGMGAIDRLIYVIGEHEVMPILSATIQKLLVHPDWRYKYTALMALSQIGEYIEEPEKISSVLLMILSYLKDQHPMMRYAACHALGQISDDMQPKFQEQYGSKVYPELILLLRDPVPRVSAHAAAALTNFLEGMTQEQIGGQLNELMEILLNMSYNGISLVKESALSAISSTVQIAKERFDIYLEKSVSILFDYFSNQKYSAKEYKQLKGQAIQTLTIIAESVGGQMFKFAAPKLIQLMIALQSSQFEQTDPQKCYLLAGWQRLCLVYGKDLAESLDQILPSLFALVENVIKTELELVNNPEPKEEEESKQIEKEGKEENINTFETEEAEVAISMLNVFIEQLKQLYNPYVEKTVNLLCVIIKEHPNEDVKEEACKCLPNLIIAVKTENQAVAVTLAKLFMQTLVQTVEKEYDSDIIIVQLETLKNVIEQLDLTFLTENEVSAFTQKILNLLKNSDEKKLQSKHFMNEDQIDEDEKEMIGEEIKQEEEVQVAISELIGILFKTHKTLTLNLAGFLINNILPSVFIENQSQNMLKFGIFLIDDMVEFLGYELLQSQWFSFGQGLMRYTQEKSCVLRQAACYGLGILAQNTPNAALSPEIVISWLNSLVNAAKIPKGDEKEKTFGHCRDNAIASIGKVIKCHANLIDSQPYIAFWLACLPIRHDKGQGVIQHELLIDIMMSKPDLILANDKVQNMQKVLTVYGQIAGSKKLLNPSGQAKLKAHIIALQTDPFFADKIAVIWQHLSEKHRASLTAFMK